MTENTRRLFGTDGVRGVANCYPMTTEIAMQLGRAAAQIVKQGTHRRHRIVIGKDTRLSGYMIENALASGICSMGVDVLLVGPLPTPGIAFITSSMRADAGVVISASHNQFQDNGIKIFSGDGFKLPDEAESEIESLIFNGGMDSLGPHRGERGQGVSHRRRPGKVHRFFEEHLSPEFEPGWFEDCGGLRPRRGLSLRARGV